MTCQFPPAARRLAALILILLAPGCGGGEDKWSASRPKPVPAGGVVLYNGDPVEGATVVFVPQDHDHPATGLTDARGRFTLLTYDPGDGAVPGAYQVTVRKVEVISEATADESDDYEGPPPEQRPLLPDRYASAETSGFTETVTEGGDNEFTFELE